MYYIRIVKGVPVEDYITSLEFEQLVAALQSGINHYFYKFCFFITYFLDLN